uniref:Interleukin 10 receptor, beta n=3 Tax=Iconisemion striatum TaxID=60296 RepID=A0A1A7WD89_9TELE
MSACVCAFILTSSAVLAVFSEVPSPPSSVTLNSRNLDLVLSWDPPDRSPGRLSYSTEFRSAITAFQPACQNITELRCDLSLFNISIYGNYSGRVQALLGARRSPWTASNHIVPDKQTVIGPPSVLLISYHQTLVVGIEDPKFVHSSLRNVFHSVSYNISYWKMGQEREPRHRDRIRQSRMVLDSLDPWSEYCVQVIITTSRNQHPSEPSEVVCEKTSSEDSPWVPAVIVFVVMVILVVLVVLVVLRWRHISQFLCLKDAVPDSITQTLLAPPESSMFLAMRNSAPIEEINHQVSVVAAVRTVEDGGPLQAGESLCSRQPDG